MTLPAPLAPLAAHAQFVVYRFEPNYEKPGKMHKFPCDWRTGALPPRGEGGSAIWTDHATATANAARCDRGHGHGVGFSLAADDPYWFLDIDNCYADGWSTLATQLVERLTGAAVEVSQSGTGLHLIGRGVVPPHRCKNIPLGIELYTEKRFIALTGTHAVGNVDHDASAAIASVVADYFAPVAGKEGDRDVTDWTNVPCAEWVGPVDDDELIARMLASNSTARALGKGVTIQALWEADAVPLSQKWPADKPGHAYDASAVDGALFAHLLWWTGHDHERTDRIARRSGLYREKYERSDYMTNSIMRADRMVTGCYVNPADRPAVAPPVLVDPSTVVAAGLARTAMLSEAQLKDKAETLLIDRWIHSLGMLPWYDEFADIIRVGSQQITDHIEREMWISIREQSTVKFSKDLFADVLRDIAYRNRRHPLREWLAAVQPTWDGMPRLDGWMTTYLGVERSPYSKAVGSLLLTAAVRRVRSPGAKFDEMIVLEGPQGIEKSSAIAALCEQPEWFCDDIHLGMTSKELLEVTDGKWIVEAPEMIKAKGAPVEHMKAMLSRRTDRARKAFDRNATERGRQWVAFATTNPDGNGYLSDTTGNRRLWPVVVTSVDLAGIARDRRQLWAEAAQREAGGASIRLPEHLWAVAAEVQAERVVTDTTLEKLEAMLGEMTGRVRGVTLLDAMGVPIVQHQAMNYKLGVAMKALGWDYKNPRHNGIKTRFYVKGEGIMEIKNTGSVLSYVAVPLRAVS